MRIVYNVQNVPKTEDILRSSDIKTIVTHILPTHKIEKVVGSLIDELPVSLKNPDEIKMNLTNEILTKKEGSIILAYTGEGEHGVYLLSWMPFDEFILLTINELASNYKILGENAVVIESIPVLPKIKNSLENELRKFEQNKERVENLEITEKILFPEKESYIPVKLLEDKELKVVVVDIFNPYSGSQEKYLCTRYGYVKLPKNLNLASVQDYLLAMYNIPRNLGKEEIDTILKAQFA